mgnify:CR=1 FL=1
MPKYSPELPIGEWTDIKISQVVLHDGRYEFTIYIGGKFRTYVRKINTEPRVFKNLKVFMGDNNHPAAPARVHDFRIASIGKLEIYTYLNIYFVLKK